MQNPLDFSSLSGTRDRGRGGSYAGAMGAFGLLAALFTQSTLNASGSFKIVVYGLLAEVARRVFQWLYARVLIQPRVSATFTQGDPAYEWIMLYLTEEGVWKKSKDFDVSAKSTKRQFTIAPSFEELKMKLSVDIVPKWTTPHLFRWDGYWIDVARGTDEHAHPNQPASTLRLQFFSPNPVVIARFVEDTKRRYDESNRARVTIHLSDSNMGSRRVWGSTKSKIRRPLGTVALPPGVMESILADVKEFIGIEDWYVQAGIPHHRGYLLYGPPGTGKSSTIYALAGELGLEIYALSLSGSSIDDAYLHRLAAAVPRGSILLIEDIDCAFPSRDAEVDEEEPALAMTASSRGGQRVVAPATVGRVTMSGVLNLMDGVASDDGRIIFATTNYYDRLDPALVRPGRIDVKIEYQLATHEQAQALFERFFPPERFCSKYVQSSSIDADLVKQTRPSMPVSVLADLGQEFAAAVPEGEFSAAELQGFLLTCKWDPEHAVSRIGAWIDVQRAERIVRHEKERETKASAGRRGMKVDVKQTASADKSVAVVEEL